MLDKHKYILFKRMGIKEIQVRANFCINVSDSPHGFGMFDLYSVNKIIILMFRTSVF